MPSDYQEIAYRVAVGSDIVRILPNAAYIIYAAGTTTPEVTSGTADSNGVIDIASLDTGHYDLWVDGALRKSFHHVRADYVQKHAETLKFHIAGSVSGDVNEDPGHEIYFVEAASQILKVKVTVQHVDGTGDATIHILKGVAQGGSALAFATDSIWSIQCNPQSEVYRWAHSDTSPGLSVEAQRCLTIAVDYVAGTIEGVTVELVIKAD